MLALYHGLTKAPKAVIGAGFCGGFTTWSTASWETVRLAQEGGVGAALSNGFGGLLASVAADLHITELVDGNKGVHAMIPKTIFVRSQR